MIDSSRSIFNLKLKNESGSYGSKSGSTTYNLMEVRDTYFCLLCNKKFIQKSSYQNHLRIHEKHQATVHSCNICHKSFAVPARLTRHYRTHTGEKPYQCEYCTKSFSVKENLSVHRRIHTKERPYRCDVCHSGFEHSGKLHRHMRIHTGERPHKCSICDKTFIQSGQLVIHMRTHTGEKPYICKLCGKGFTCSKQLKVHTRTHTGEKPYKCDICGKSFGYNHVLKLHQVAHYGDKFYKCIICQKSFKSKKLMELHIKSPSNCELYDVAQLKSISSKSTDVINDAAPHNTNYKKFTEKSILQKSGNPKQKLEQLIYQKPDHNFSNDFTSISKPDIASKIILSDDVSHSQSFSLIRQKIKERTHVKQANSSTIQSSYSKLEETILSQPSETKSLSVDENLNEYCEKITRAYSMSSPLHTTDLDINVQNSRNYFTLPLRKRCKIITESFELDNCEFNTPKRCNSVIKFAKTDQGN